VAPKCPVCRKFFGKWVRCRRDSWIGHLTISPYQSCEYYYYDDDDDDDDCDASRNPEP